MTRHRTPNFTAETLREWLSYDPATGVFRWLQRPSNRVRVGDAAGSLNDQGYVLIGVFGVNYRGHKLAWFHMTGEWPDFEIDHENHVRHDNAWRNLRRATGSQNLANRKRAAVGMTPTKHGKFVARMKANGKVIHLGTFRTFEEAKVVRDERFRAHFGEFARI